MGGPDHKPVTDLTHQVALGGGSLPPEEWNKGIRLDSLRDLFHPWAAPLNLPLLLFLPHQDSHWGLPPSISPLHVMQGVPWKRR